jgi:hypothetical protein
MKYRKHESPSPMAVDTYFKLLMAWCERGVSEHAPFNRTQRLAIHIDPVTGRETYGFGDGLNGFDRVHE